MCFLKVKGFLEYLGQCVTQHVKQVLKLETKQSTTVAIEARRTEVRSHSLCGQQSSKLATHYCA